MTTPAIKQTLNNSFASLLDRIRTEISANGTAAAPANLVPGVQSINREAPIREIVASLNENATVNLDTNFNVDECLIFNVHLQQNAILTIQSAQPIAVLGGTTETNHTLQGPITRSFILKKTSVGWNLFI